MRILLKWLSLCPIDIRVEMREQLKRSKLETLGDSGTLLEVFLFDADLDAIEDDKAKLLLEIASNSLNKWNDYFYIHYNEIIAEQIRRALLDNNGGRNGFFCFRRSKNGDFARASGQLPISVPNHKKEKVFPPPHLYGHLARSKRGQKLLQNFNIFGKLEQIICNFLQNGILSDFQMGEVKGSLFALAQILSNLPSSVNFPIIKYTQLLLECVLQKNNNSINFPWLSIRGCAIWAINIAAKTENQLVIQTLFEAGWEFGEFFDNFELKNQKNKIKNFISSNKLQKRKIILKRKRTKSEYIEEENLKNVLYRSSSLDSFFIILNSTSSIKAIDYSFFEKEFYNKFYERANIKELSINNLNKKETLKITEKENIFNENKNKKSSFYSLEKKYLNKKHCKFLCIFCSIPKQLNIEKEIVKEKEKEKIEDEIRQLIYQFATQFSNTEIALKLLRIYKVQPEAFDNRCLFSDAINFLSDSRTISFGGRRLLYQLFWKALSN
uniref:Uncharacterized protein n=1 Tax=Meloidogyne hapla TaxID=6305 RepID=A0A1I8B812_MELHA